MAQRDDLVLVLVEDKPAFFARIERIEPDVKPEWCQVTLLVLQVPPVQVTWILRPEYIEGTSFTMGGKKMVIERVGATPGGAPAEQKPPPSEERTPPAGARKKAKVIPLFPGK